MNNANKVKEATVSAALNQNGAIMGLSAESNCKPMPGFELMIEHKTLGCLTKKVYTREDIITFLSNLDMNNIWGINITPTV